LRLIIKERRMVNLHADANQIMEAALKRAQPDETVKQALCGRDFSGGQLVVIAVGKAAVPMARTALSLLPVDRGVVITKYGHARGAMDPLEVYEAGHPMPDENGYHATARALEMVKGLTERDHVLMLISGGGSALFEAPLVAPESMAKLTGRLLRSGADIRAINAIRKRLSAVKGGKFALCCAPARVTTIALSDVLGDAPDAIASGPAAPDRTTCQDALDALLRYGVEADEEILKLLQIETPKALPNAECVVAGGVRILCEAAAEACRKLGYEPVILTDSLDCEAREAGRFLAAIARRHHSTGRRLAFLAGGETVVHVTGTVLGGRNEELALAAAEGIAGLNNTLVFSFGSDGTDGPTDAAGGIVDGGTAAALAAKGLSPEASLKDNDAYHALSACEGLLITGPTGTNVNDLSVLLIGE
jgi:hydroxypyruvate reductase